MSQVVIAVRAIQTAIVDLFEDIKRFFIRLKLYAELPPMEQMTEIIVDVMVHVLHILALLTTEIKQGKISGSIPHDMPLPLTYDPLERFLKKLTGKSDIEDALRRFEKLTQEESRMVAVQDLVATCAVREEVTGLGINVVDISDGVNVANNKLDVVLDGAHLVSFWPSMPLSDLRLGGEDMRDELRQVAGNVSHLAKGASDEKRS